MYDVIVIGAGPAGSSAARKTSQLGLKTLLLEKEKLRRNKLCGGAVTPKVLRLLDFAIHESIFESAPRTARVHVGDSVFKLYSHDPLVYMTSRENFDSVLSTKAKEAGAEVLEDTLVQNVVRRPGHVEVQARGGSFEAKAVIGCDGTGGPTARVTGINEAWNPNCISYAIESEVPVGEPSVQEFMGKEGCFDLYFGVSPAGYGWVFPKRSHLTVGIGCKLIRLRDGPRLFNEFIRRVPVMKGYDIPKPQAHLVPLGGAVNFASVGDRVLLAGDAAGFAEPLLGEGIYFAIYAGQIAAEVIGVACRTGKFDTGSLRTYAKRCEAAFGVDFKAAYKLAKASYLESYDMDGIAKYFFSQPIFQQSMIKVLEGTMRYRDVQKKLAWLYLKYRLSRVNLPFGS